MNLCKIQGSEGGFNLKQKLTRKEAFNEPGGAASGIALSPSPAKLTPGGIDSTSPRNLRYSSGLKMSAGLLEFTNSLNLEE